MSSPHILNVFAHNLNVKPQTLNAFRPPNLNVLTTLIVFGSQSLMCNLKKWCDEMIKAERIKVASQATREKRKTQALRVY
jgi:hypothetical protein